MNLLHRDVRVMARNSDARTSVDVESSHMRNLLGMIVVTVILAACGPFGANSGATAPSPTAPPSASGTGLAEFQPGPGSLSGRVLRIIPDGLVVDAADHEATVNLKLVLDIWKERPVPASAVEVGDSVFINGTEGSPFVARYVWINMGRIDGVILAIDTVGMSVQVRSSMGTRTEQVEFSADIQYGAADGSVKLTRADLVVGRTIGAVVYRPLVGQARVTRIW